MSDPSEGSVQAVSGFHDDHLADRMMSIAESRSLDALGIACGSALRDLTCSAAVGLYLLDAVEPDLAYSQNVAEDFLDNYRSGFWKSDPVLDCILTQGRTVDGASLLGADGWSRSTSLETLRHWGFSCNMGGPLRHENRIIGVLFTATREASAYTPLQRQRMEMLCRAASLALANIRKTGQTAFPGGENVSPASGNSSAIMLRNPAPLSMAALNEKLPPRSADVAIRVCRGQTNKEIAREMGISDQTVKEHVANLCKRFGTHNRTGLVVCLLGGMSQQ
jgi:DNA-binding CsgD family transcriptional regulator